jgi:hypothetical protein
MPASQQQGESKGTLAPPIPHNKRPNHTAESKHQIHRHSHRRIPHLQTTRHYSSLSRQVSTGRTAIPPPPREWHPCLYSATPHPHSHPPENAMGLASLVDRYRPSPDTTIHRIPQHCQMGYQPPTQRMNYSPPDLHPPPPSQHLPRLPVCKICHQTSVPTRWTQLIQPTTDATLRHLSAGYELPEGPHQTPDTGKLEDRSTAPSTCNIDMTPAINLNKYDEPALRHSS